MVVDLVGALVDINYMEHSEDPPIALALDPPISSDIVELLLSRGANPLVGYRGGTYLHTAVDTLGNYWDASDSSPLVILMEAIAKAKAAKDPYKLASRRELYMLDVADDLGHTPLSKAMTLCITRRKIVHKALVKCGIDIDLFPSGERCPAQKPLVGLLAPWCFCDEDSSLDGSDQSSVDSGSEESEDGVSANDVCEGTVFEPGGSDGFSQLLSSAEQVSPYTLLIATLSDTVKAGPSFPRVQPTFDNGRNNSLDSQMTQISSFWSTVPDFSSINIQDGSSGPATVATDSTASTSAATGCPPSFLEPPILLDHGRLHVAPWDDQLRRLDRTRTQPSATANRWLGNSIFQADSSAPETPAFLRMWSDPSAANALEENAWSRCMEVDSDAVSPLFQH